MCINFIKRDVTAHCTGGSLVCAGGLDIYSLNFGFKSVVVLLSCHLQFRVRKQLNYNLNMLCLSKAFDAIVHNI